MNKPSTAFNIFIGSILCIMIIGTAALGYFLLVPSDQSEPTEAVSAGTEQREQINVTDLSDLAVLLETGWNEVVFKGIPEINVTTLISITETGNLTIGSIAEGAPGAWNTIYIRGSTPVKEILTNDVPYQFYMWEKEE